MTGIRLIIKTNLAVAELNDTGNLISKLIRV